MIKSYKQFVSGRNFGYLNENIKQANTFLQNKALAEKKKRFEKEGSDISKVGLNADEIRLALSDPNYTKIKDMLGDNQALVYTFTKFFYEDLSSLDEKTRFEELQILLNKLKKLRSSLSNLPKPIDYYVSKAANDEERKLAEEEGRQYRPAKERLDDDLRGLERGIAYNKWVAELLSWQKEWVDNATTQQKDRIQNIAVAFDQYGTDENGVKDLAKNKALTKFFFVKIKDYKNLADLLKAAEDNIKATNNASFEKFVVSMQNVNKKYGDALGCEQLYLNDGILIIEVRSFAANKELNANTEHCITRTIGHWETYVGEEKFTKQFYIYNFNLPPTDNKSVIGITIGVGEKITACHLKNDKPFSQEIVALLKEWNIPKDVMLGMTKEEVEQRKKRIEASKLIVKPNLSFEQVSEYLALGANPNAMAGKPLDNAVKEDKIDIAELLLDKGAIPTINNPIKFAKNLDMIKLLVKNNCPLTNEVFNSILNDIEAVKFVLDNGSDPNFEQGFPLRAAARVGNLDVVKLLVERGARIAERRYMVIKQCVEYGQIDILEFLLEQLQKSDPAFKNEETLTKMIIHWKSWLSSSLQIPQEKKDEVSAILDTQLQ